MTATPNAHVLICGTSTRGAAASAVRAGFRVTTIDGYADRDHHAEVHALSMPRDFGGPATAHALARAARTIDCDAVVYLSPFENHPRAVTTLTSGRALWGNTPEVLRRVRDPWLLATGLGRHALAVPALTRRRDTLSLSPPSDPNHVNDQQNPNIPNVPNASPPNDWFVKPFRSGGGHHIRRWTGDAIPRHAYLQEAIVGTPGSVVFVAARGRAVALAVTRQLVGDAAFGSSGHRYCGSIVAPPGDPQFTCGERLHEGAIALAVAAAAEFGLSGVGGIDFVERDGVPLALELNPRWSASMELVERLGGPSVFRLHAAACLRGELPQALHQSPVAAAGKAIVFARERVVVGVTDAWLEESWIADVPQSGERFTAGQPVCTVLAEATDAAGCYAALTARASAIL